MRLTLTLCLLTGSAFPAMAEDFQRPDQCERVVTAQYSDCSVTNTFRCKGAAEPFWLETVDAEGFVIIETRNGDHGSTMIHYLGKDMSIRLNQSKAHPRDVVASGSGADTIAGEFSVFGVTRPISGSNSYSYAGEQAEHSGVTFERLSFQGEVVMLPPMTTFAGSGTMLYSPGLDTLVEELTRFEAGLVQDPVSLIRLSLTGYEGFGDEIPMFGCGELSLIAPNGTGGPA